MTLDPDSSRPAGEATEAFHREIPTLDSISQDAWLLRDRTATELNERGFKISPASLATKATRGGGPPFRIFGKSAVYRWGDVVAWVLETMGWSYITGHGFRLSFRDWSAECTNFLR
jgi:hypothetical protein